jgi:uncharacterized protein YigA (DUF484 family)
LASFAVAVIFQTAMLKRNVEIITTRITKIEDDMSKITQLLISNEGLTQRVTALTERVHRMEDLTINQRISALAPSAPSAPRQRKPVS